MKNAMLHVLFVMGAVIMNVRNVLKDILRPIFGVHQRMITLVLHVMIHQIILVLLVLKIVQNVKVNVLV